MKLFQNELIKSKTLLFLGVDIFIQIIVFLFVKKYIVDIYESYSKLPNSTYWYVTYTGIYLLVVLPIQILYQNLRESLIEDNNNGWYIMLKMGCLDRIIYIKMLINLLRCFICYLIYTIFCLYLLKDIDIDTLLNNVLFPSVISFVLFLPIAIFMQICCLFCDSILAKVIPTAFFIIVIITTFQSDWNLFIPVTYFYTIIQSTANLDIKLVVCILILGIEFLFLKRLIKIKRKLLV